MWATREARRERRSKAAVSEPLTGARRAYSSAGESARLISVRSLVQAQVGPCEGGVAQLGEHLPCKQGVSGSNPLVSMDRGGDTGGSSASKRSLTWRSMSTREVDEKNWSQGREGYTVDALARCGEEGRGDLRKALGSWPQTESQGCPNGGTRLSSWAGIQR